MLFRLRELCVLVGARLIAHGLCLLLCGLHGLKRFRDLIGRWVGVLNFYVYKRQTDVVFLQNFGYKLFDTHLDRFLAGRQNSVHGFGADHVAHLTLQQVAQNRFRVIRAVEVLFRVADLVLHVSLSMMSKLSAEPTLR